MSTLNQGSMSGKWSKGFWKKVEVILEEFGKKKRDPPLGLWRCFCHFLLSSNPGCEMAQFSDSLWPNFCDSLWPNSAIPKWISKMRWGQSQNHCSCHWFGKTRSVKMKLICQDSHHFLCSFGTIRILTHPTGIFRCWLTPICERSRVGAGLALFGRDGGTDFSGLPNLDPRNSLISKFYWLGGLNIMSIEAAVPKDIRDSGNVRLLFETV